MVREPLRWCLDLGTRASAEAVLSTLRPAALGPCDATWSPPSWLLAHQVVAARRLVARLACFRGALLADAVGLGKTYVALAVVTRYLEPVALVPAALEPQWRRVATTLGVPLTVTSHEALSRGAPVPSADVIVVDEAHRFCRPETRRYDRLARAAPGAHVLLLSATPVVNRPADLVHLLRLFLPDHGLALHGVPSLADAPGARKPEPLARACSALVVARSPEAVRTTLPDLVEVGDGEVVAAPPLAPDLLGRVAEGVSRLDFPSFTDRQAAELLRLHLWYRLASSAPALRSTLRRHSAYLDRAIAAAARGERLSRRAARVLFGPDEGIQLALDVGGQRRGRLDAAALVAERDRIEQLRALLRSSAPTDPKADLLVDILARRPGKKTLVFTSAVATASHLARRLGWRRLCAATARGARIASGPIGLEEALALFAPIAQRAPQPPPTLRLDTLIATDLLSEGLDLQDADAVVHYDLPWTPLRLEQRLGRVARLGSRHARVWVWWFQPCASIDERLAMVERLRGKLGGQLRLGVPASGTVGRARVVGGLFDWRERFGDAAAWATGPPCFAVVHGPRVGVFALRWMVGTHAVPELLVVAGDPPVVVEGERPARSLIEGLIGARASAAPPPHALTEALSGAVRRRLAHGMRGPNDDDTRRLARQVLRLAARAASARDLPWLRWLDDTLSHITRGLPIGAARGLGEALASGRCAMQAHHWSPGMPPMETGYASVRLEAALLGDGALTMAEARRIFVSGLAPDRNRE